MDHSQPRFRLRSGASWTLRPWSVDGAPGSLVFELSCAAVDARRVERALASVDGVTSAYLNPVTETAYVEYDPTEVDTQALVLAIEGAGFHAGRPVDA